MGHETATIRVRPDELPEPLKPSSNSGFYAVRDNLEDRILRAALDEWRMEAGGGDSPRCGTPVMLSSEAEELAFDKAEEYVRKNRTEVTAIVPVVTSAGYEIRTKTLTVKLDGEEWRKYISGGWYGVLKNKIAEAMPQQFGKVVNWSIVDADKSGRDSAKGWTLNSKVEADASGGKAKTVYLVSIDGKLQKKQFETQALARAASVEFLEKNPQVLEAEVTAKTIREDGSALVKVRRVVRSATAKVTVSYVHMKTTAPKTDGWIVAFDYHT